MLFNSVQYMLFLPICILIYYCLQSKINNRFLLLVSYFFYMCWNPCYVLLLIFSTVITWVCGFGIKRSQNIIMRKIVLWGTLAINISILFVFKYYNFFWDTISVFLIKIGM